MFVWSFVVMPIESSLPLRAKDLFCITRRSLKVARRLGHGSVCLELAASD